MIERMEGAPEGVLAFRAVGEVHADDYKDVLRPAVDKALAAGAKLRVVFEIGSQFERFSAGAAWDDAALGFANLGHWERCAVVTDHDWVRHAVKAFGWMMGGRLRLFEIDELKAALEWAAADD
jgi:hypothetical protein